MSLAEWREHHASGWMQYVARVSENDTHTQLAERMGISQSAVNRWRTSVPKPETVIAFARAYGRPVSEAFVNIGWLPEQELSGVQEVRTSARDLSNEELIKELERRLNK